MISIIKSFETPIQGARRARDNVAVNLLYSFHIYSWPSPLVSNSSSNSAAANSAATLKGDEIC